MKEGKIHAIITSLIALATIGLLIADSFVMKTTDGMLFFLFACPVLIIAFTIYLDLHYLDPDRGLNESNDHPILFGRPGFTRKSFDEYSPVEVWLWRLGGYWVQLIFLALALVLYFLFRM